MAAQVHNGNPRLVRSSDGTRIAVFESGDPSGPVIVAVHGYPDNHATWDEVALVLGEDYRFVSYDVRGAGASDRPRARAAYRIERLTEDFRAVLDATCPDGRVHLLAHDWGSIQSWGPVTDPSLAPRIATFTSISGPSMDYVGVWLRDPKHLGATLSQLAHSYYLAVFQLPRFPEWLMRRRTVRRYVERVEGGRPVHRSGADWGRGINLYRANVFQRLFRPRPVRTAVPTLVLAPREDPFAGVPVVTGAPAPYVDDLTVTEIAGSHWVIRTAPRLVARHVHEFITARTPVRPKRKGRR